MSTVPVPSTTRVTDTEVSFVSRWTVACRGLREACRPEAVGSITSPSLLMRRTVGTPHPPARSRCGGQGGAESAHFLRCPDAHPQPTVRPGLPDEHAGVDQFLPDPVRIGENTEQHE